MERAIPIERSRTARSIGALAHNLARSVDREGRRLNVTIEEPYSRGDVPWRLCFRRVDRRSCVGRARSAARGHQCQTREHQGRDDADSRNAFGASMNEHANSFWVAARFGVTIPDTS
jgi:hypothetical protein